MAIHEHGEVEVSALGKTWTLRFGVNEMLELQNMLGLADQDVQFMQVMEELERKPSLRKVRAFVYCCLKRQHPEADELVAGDILTELTLESFADRVLPEILKWAQPKQQQEPPPGGAARPSRGPASSKTRPGRG